MGAQALEKGPLFEAVLERIFSDAKTLKQLGASSASSVFSKRKSGRSISWPSESKPNAFVLRLNFCR